MIKSLMMVAVAVTLAALIPTSSAIPALSSEEAESSLTDSLLAPKEESTCDSQIATLKKQHEAALAEQAGVTAQRRCHHLSQLTLSSFPIS
jgi:hypothetical protein